ncbi:MAG: glycosyltransferase family 39 protein [Elusimicrobia bacterium]|nr:glycosyltransferase family 39 protein [Elusimicrobiota bacterium]
MSTRSVPAVLWTLLAVVATMPFWDLGHPLWEVDDARYAEVPREMVERGDWLTPSLNYVEYLQKPPLIYWLGALSYSAFGVSEAAARVPLALLALLGLAGVLWLGWWLFDPATGVTAAILLGTCVQFSILSHLLTPDMALAVFLLWSSAMILRAIHRPQDAWWAGPIGGAAAGLAFLSKGLVGFLFPGAWTVGLALLFPEARRGVTALLKSAAIPVALLVVAPWFWVMTKRHPGFLYHFFIEHHLLRYLTPEFNRPGPWYYFIGIGIAGLLPWTPLALGAIAAPALQWRASDARVRQLVVWVALIFAFFTASKSKLPTYILPLFPQQCLLAAEFLRRGNWDRRELSLSRGAAIFLAASAGLGLFAALVLREKWSVLATLGLGHWITAIFFSAALIAALLLQATGDAVPERPFAGAAAAGSLLTLLALVGARQTGYLLSADAVASEILSMWRPGDKIYTYDHYLQGLPYYTRKPVDSIVNWKGEFGAVEKDPRYKTLLLDDNAIRALPASGRTTFVVVRPRVYEHFMTLAAPGRVKRVAPFPNGIVAVMQ